MDPGVEIRACLRAIGSGKDAYLVGGTVRDRLLGSPVKDIDCATEDPPEAVARAFAERVSGSLVPLDPERGLYRVVAGTNTYDFSRLDPAGITADLSRRDFTVNAMASRLDASPSYVIDPFGGRSDLARRTVRMVAEQNLLDDPLRVLRAYRFAAVLGFRIEDGTAEALARNADRIPRAAAERITEEWRLLLASPRSFPAVAMMERDGVLSVLWPELGGCRSIPQNAYHHLDVLEHSLLSLEELENRLDGLPFEGGVRDAVTAYLSDEPWRLPVLKTAALVHDIGKPGASDLSPDGRVTFHRHERIGAELLEDALERWRFSGRERALLKTLVRYHLTIPALARVRERLRPGTPLRWLARWREDLYALFLLACADRAAARGPLSEGEWEEVTRFGLHLHELYRETVQPLAAAPPLVTGKDLRERFRLSPGPVFGKILRRVEREVLHGRISTKEEAFERIRDWIAERNASF